MFTPPPMTAPESGKQFTPHLVEQGQYPARLVWLIAIGTQEIVWNGETKKQKKLMMGFELPTAPLPDDHPRKGEPSFISETFTFSMSDKASLRSFIDSWRGKALTDDEAKAFDIGKMVSQPAVVNIIHKTGSKDPSKTYANVGSIQSEGSLAKMMPGFKVPPQVNETIYFNVEWFNTSPEAAAYALDQMNKIPKYLQEKIEGSQEYKVYTQQAWYKPYITRDNGTTTTTTPVVQQGGAFPTGAPTGYQHPLGGAQATMDGATTAQTGQEWDRGQQEDDDGDLPF